MEKTGITFRLTKDDLNTFENYVCFRSQRKDLFIKVIVIPIAILLVPLVIACLLNKWDRLGSMFSVAYPLALFISLPIFGHNYLGRKHHQKLHNKETKESGYLDHSITICLNENGIIHKGYAGESINYWHSIHGIINDNNHIYIYLSDKNTFLL
nr:YcxB family protein [bacterium]